MFVAWHVAQASDVQWIDNSDGRDQTYEVSGQIFFASTEAFYARFEMDNAPLRVTIDVTRAHFRDISAVHALDRVVFRLWRNGAVVTVGCINHASQTLIDRHRQHERSDVGEGPAH